MRWPATTAASTSTSAGTSGRARAHLHEGRHCRCSWRPFACRNPPRVAQLDRATAYEASGAGSNPAASPAAGTNTRGRNTRRKSSMEQITQAADQLGVDPGGRARASRPMTTATMPFIYPHLALMPDAHLGKGATVGSVIPTLGAIIPAAVGVDIGCGMIAVRTQSSHRRPAGAPAAAARGDRCGCAAVGRQVQRGDLRRDATRARISSLERRWQVSSRPTRPSLRTGACSWARSARATTSSRSASTRTDRVWLFLHSGSRGVGNKLAHEAHHGRPARSARSGGSACPTPTSPTSWRATAEFWSYIGGPAVGAAVRATQPRGDDGPRDRLLRELGRCRSWSGGGDQLPPQLHRSGEALRQGRVAVPQGCDRRWPRAFVG